MRQNSQKKVDLTVYEKLSLPQFKKLFAHLPSQVQKQARIAYSHFKNDPYYPSLHCECVNKREQIYSARIGNSYRALAYKDGEIINWYWIGPHEEYNHLV